MDIKIQLSLSKNKFIKKRIKQSELTVVDVGANEEIKMRNIVSVYLFSELEGRSCETENCSLPFLIVSPEI